MNKRKLGIASVILILDQVTKLIIDTYNVHCNIIKNLFSLNYYQNTGAAWGVFKGQQTFLILITIVLLLLVFNLMYSYEENHKSDLAFGILIGGILGNFCDRIFYGFVRDFIDITILNYAFPVFNIADMAIVVGVILLFVITIKGSAKNGNKSRRVVRKNR